VKEGYPLNRSVLVPRAVRVVTTPSRTRRYSVRVAVGYPNRTARTDRDVFGRLPLFRQVPMHSTYVRSFVALVGILLIAGCGDSNATAPRYHPQVVNLTNDFAFQVTTLDNVSDNVQYIWRTDGSVVNVNQSPSNLSGTVSLVIFDAAGTQVYSRSLAENGTFTTGVGKPGDWTVSIRFSQASGAVNFRIQKP
jgi:hypothetical protein